MVKPADSSQKFGTGSILAGGERPPKSRAIDWKKKPGIVLTEISNFKNSKTVRLTDFFHFKDPPKTGVNL